MIFSWPSLTEIYKKYGYFSCSEDSEECPSQSTTLASIMVYATGFLGLFVCKFYNMPFFRFYFIFSSLIFFVFSAFFYFFSVLLLFPVCVSLFSLLLFFLRFSLFCSFFFAFLFILFIVLFFRFFSSFFLLLFLFFPVLLFFLLFFSIFPFLVYNLVAYGFIRDYMSFGYCRIACFCSLCFSYSILSISSPNQSDWLLYGWVVQFAAGTSLMLNYFQIAKMFPKLRAFLIGKNFTFKTPVSMVKM